MCFERRNRNLPELWDAKSLALRISRVPSQLLGEDHSLKTNVQRLEWNHAVTFSWFLYIYIAFLLIGV